MTRTLFPALLGASLAIAAHIAPASAQTSGGDTATVVTRSAADLTCSDLVGMNGPGVSNVLYYVAGYTARGWTDMQADAGASSEPAHALAPTGSDNTTSAATAGEGARVAANEASAPTATTIADAAIAVETGVGATLSAVGGAEIDVEQALSDCEAAPEARLPDVLDRQRMPNN